MTSWRPLRLAARKQETRRSRFWPEAATRDELVRRCLAPARASSSSTSASLRRPCVPPEEPQRRALAEQPVDAVHALVGEQLLEAEAGAAVGAQVAGVEQALAVGLDEQRARVGRRVVDGDGRHREAAEAQAARRSAGSAGRAGSVASGKNTRPTSRIAIVPSLP